MRQRNKRIWCHLSDDEYELLKSSLDACGYNQESYIRSLICGYAPKAKPPIDYKHFMKALYAIGLNINQIAMKANATNRIDKDWFKQEMDKMNTIIRELEHEIQLPGRIEQGGEFLGSDGDLED